MLCQLDVTNEFNRSSLYKDQTIIVAGAGSGIGQAAAVKLATLGGTIVCADISVGAADETLAKLNAISPSSYSLQLDVTEYSSVDHAVSEIIKRSGKIHALLNSVGITGSTNVLTHRSSISDFQRVIQVNLLGSYFLSRSIIPHMLKNQYGRILHVASIAGKDGNAGMSAYSSSKAGVIGLVKSLGKEYAQSGITINALAPAVIQTPLVDALPTETIQYMTSKIPMGRCGQLDEAANLIRWILSQECSFTTGFTFDLSGGRAVY